MNLNQFESTSERTLTQLLHTLDHVHGIKFNIDYTNPNLNKILDQCKESYEILRDKIIKESAFNSYQTNPEYIKSMLVLEAVKILTEIAPKRLRRKRMNEDMQAVAKPTLSTQLSAIASKVPGNDETSAAVSNAIASIADKLLHRGTSFSPDSKLNDQDTEILNAIKAFPKPISVSNLIASLVSEFGKKLVTNRNMSTSKMPVVNNEPEVDEVIAPTPPVGAPTIPVRPPGTNPLQPVPGSQSGSDDYKNNAIAAIVNNHQKNLITPDIAKQQLKAQGLQDPDINNIMNGNTQGTNNQQPNQPPTSQPPISEESNSGLSKIVDLGQQMITYSNDTRTDDEERLKVLNAFSRVGDKLSRMGTAFGPGSLTDNEKNIIRLFQKHVKLAKMGEKMDTDSVENNVPVIQARQTDSRPGMGNVMNETYQTERARIKEALTMIKRINEFKDDGSIGSTGSIGAGGPELAKAQVIIAAKAITGKVQDMAEDVAKLGVDDLMPLVDMMREQFGPEVSDGFNTSFKQALDTLLDLTTKTKDELSTAVDTLSTGGIPSSTTDIEIASPDGMSNDDFGGGTDSDIATDFGGDDQNGDLDVADAGDEDELEEPLGRAKKDDALAEAKKGSQPPWLKGKGKSDKKDDKKSSGKKLPPWLKKNVKESAPPGKEAKDFISNSKSEFKKKYGKDWEKKLYATAWKKFGESNNAYNTAEKSVLETKTKIANLNAKMIAHKTSFVKSVNEGKSTDPLGLGYGLEGDVIISQINRLNKKIAESKSIMLHEMQTGIKRMLTSFEIEKKILAIAEAKQNTPYGIIYKTSTGKKSCKMFESEDIRSHWMTLRSDNIIEYSMIGPDTFDKAIVKTIAG